MVEGLGFKHSFRFLADGRCALRCCKPASLVSELSRSRSCSGVAFFDSSFFAGHGITGQLKPVETIHLQLAGGLATSLRRGGAVAPD